MALAVAAPAAPAQAPTIAPRVTSAGVELGGLTVDAAAARLQSELGRELKHRVLVAAGRKRIRLEPGDADVRFYAVSTARDALKADRGEKVRPVVSVSSEKVRSFVDDVARRTRKRPRNARVRMTVRKMVVRSARFGRMVHRSKLARTVEAALADPKASRFIRARWRRVRPEVTYAKLRRQYSTVVTIDRNTFKLRLFKRLKHRKTYGIAVGAVGWSTPAGRYSITNKAVNPAWHVPSFGGELAGQVIPGGSPANPLKARWLGIVDGVGIHGTADTGSLGSRASHGCIRMTVPSVIQLYRWVPIGTPVLIR